MGLISGYSAELHEISMPVLLLLLAVVVGIWIIRLSRDSDVDFNAMRLLMSKQPDGTWKESRRAIGELTAIIVSTWGFVYLVVANQLTEWYMVAWLGVLLGWAGWKKSMETKGNVQEPPK